MRSRQPQVRSQLMQFVILVALGFLMVNTPSLKLGVDQSVKTQSENRLLVLLEDESGAFMFAVVDENGMEFFDTVEFPRLPIYRSPDGSRVAYVDVENNLRVITSQGQSQLGVSLAHLHSSSPDSYWLPMGWLDNDTVLVALAGDEQGFYQIRIDSGDPQLQAIGIDEEFLDVVSQLDGNRDYAPGWALQFSPTFEYLVTTRGIRELYNSHPFSNAFVYNVSGQLAYEIAQDVVPWYSVLIPLTLDWANHDDSLAYFVFSEGIDDCAPNLYLFTLPSNTEILFENTCDNLEPVFPLYVAWSPSDDQIAFWTTPWPTPRGDAKSYSLQLLGVESRQVQLLYESEYGPSFPGVQWSENDQMLAFITTPSASILEFHVYSTTDTKYSTTFRIESNLRVIWFDWAFDGTLD
jgi:hypothetical protein